MSTDAVLWTMSTDLFPLVRKSAIVDALRQKYDYKKKQKKGGLPYFNTAIHNAEYRTESGAIVPGVKFLFLFGEVPYHRDSTYAPYSYHLILRGRDYMVVGEDRPAEFVEDQAGDLIAMNIFESHALYHRRNALERRLTGMYRAKPRRMWASLVVDSWAQLSQDQVYDMFKYLLTFDGYRAIDESIGLFNTHP